MFNIGSRGFSASISRNGFMAGLVLAPRCWATAHPAEAPIEGSLELDMDGPPYEAAVAHFEATDKHSLLHVAIRHADRMDRLFGPDARRDVGGHPEIEPALVRLFEATGERRYLELARFFVETRGRVLDLELPDDTALRVRKRPELLGGVVTFEGRALRRSSEGDSNSQTAQRLLAIPFFAWSNRGPGEMAVWLHRTAASSRREGRPGPRAPSSTWNPVP